MGVKTMRAIFGVVSLLLALAIVGLLAANQLKAVKQVVPATAPATASGEPVARPAITGNVREQSRQLQQQIGSDVGKMLEQGARRSEDADK
jgi:hypothetical protein